jgi:glycosyltransferase involved in cell wall biosynthesis
MKILHLCDHYRPFGGAERLLFDTLAMLEESGTTNVLVMHDYPENRYSGQRKEYIVKGLDAQPVGSNFISYIRAGLRAKKRLRAIIRTEKPDVIHVHNIQNPFVIHEALKETPVVRAVHDPRLYCFTDWRLLPVTKDICPYPMGHKCITEGCIGKELIKFSLTGRKALPRYFNHELHRKVDTIIMESRAMLACALQNGYKTSQLECLPNFTLLEPLEKVLERNKGLAKQNENSIVFVGRASYEKGITKLLEAVKLINTPYRLYLITGGPEIPAVYEKIKELELSEKVSVLGPFSYEETKSYYGLADVVVVPSVWIESFCLVGIEAMANAKPVVAFRTGGIPDWLVDGETGFLAELGNTPELASKIETMLTNKEAAKQYGLAGYKRVSELYRNEVYLTQLMKIYTKAIDKRGKK